MGILAEGDGGDYGIHSEMFTTGLMRLHEAGKVSNRKGQFDGVSVATFAGGTEELYAWLNGNQDVAFLPVDVINNPDTIGRNRLMATINGALAVDIEGQVVADTINATQFSGIGGHEDFISGPGAVARGARAALPPLDGDGQRGAALADRAVVRRRRRDHHPPPPGRPDRDRVRGGGAAGKDGPRPRRGARGDRPPAVPRRAARGRGARDGRPRAVPRTLGLSRPQSPSTWSIRSSTRPRTSSSVADSIRSIASAAGTTSRDLAQQRGLERGDVAGALRVVDGADQPLLERGVELLLGDAVLGDELVALARVGDHEDEVLARHLQLARGAVERRQRQLLGQLVALLELGDRARVAGVGDLERLVARAAEREVEPDQRRGCGERSERGAKSPHQRLPMRIGTSARAAIAPASRNERLKAWVAALSTSSTIASSRAA